MTLPYFMKDVAPSFPTNQQCLVAPRLVFVRIPATRSANGLTTIALAACHSLEVQGRISDTMTDGRTLRRPSPQNVVRPTWPTTCSACPHASTPSPPAAVLPDHPPLQPAPVPAQTRRTHQQRLPLL